MHSAQASPPTWRACRSQRVSEHVSREWMSHVALVRPTLPSLLRTTIGRAPLDRTRRPHHRQVIHSRHSRAPQE